MRRLLIALFPMLVCGHAAVAHAAETARPTEWCAPEVETLPGGVCHIDGRKEGRHTLVIFLHGLIARNTTWQWTQHRAMARNAKQLGFAVIMPTAPTVGRGGSGGYAWPGSPTAEVEQQLVDGWSAAQRLLEERNGHAFDEVFVMGFSSGASYATSLALRGRLTDRRERDVSVRSARRLDVKGYALFAGGSAPAAKPGPEVQRRAPIFVGVCVRNPETAAPARVLGSSLAAWKWPSAVDEQPIGHMFGDVHVTHALAWLRAHK